MLTVSFYSYKGGVGRSLAVANLGLYLAQLGATVVLLDLDLEAPGLQYKLGISEDPLLATNRGLTGCLASIVRGEGYVSVKEIQVDVTRLIATARPADATPSGHLWLVPAGNPVQSGYWDDLAAIDWRLLFTSDRRPGVAYFDRLRKEIEELHSPDFLLVDSRTGITASGGVATTLLADTVVMMFLDTAEHLDGSRAIVRGILSSKGGNGHPEVVPVLSRYTSPPCSRGRRASVGSTIDDEDAGTTDVPYADEVLSRLHRALVEGNGVNGRQIKVPFLLHSDLTLMYREHLSFGPDAGSFSGGGSLLVDDYLRLFSSIVPRQTIEKYVGVLRERVRTILLDQPDDALRTLESLTSLVGDKSVFDDLIKLQIVRRDRVALLQACERMYRIHGEIYSAPAITAAVREYASGRVIGQFGGISVDFIEHYWRTAASDDVELGLNIARTRSKVDIRRGLKLFDQIIKQSRSAPSVIARAVSLLAAGSPDEERAAAEVAKRYFSSAGDDRGFIDAAAKTVRYTHDRELAAKVASSEFFTALDLTDRVRLLRVLGRVDELASDVVAALSSTEFDGVVDLDDLRDMYSTLTPTEQEQVSRNNSALVDQFRSEGRRMRW